MTNEEYTQAAREINSLLHQAQQLANIAWTACDASGDKAGQETAGAMSAAICDAKLAAYAMWSLKSNAPDKGAIR
jgi:hypothetical protein